MALLGSEGRARLLSTGLGSSSQWAGESVGLGWRGIGEMGGSLGSRGGSTHFLGQALVFGAGEVVQLGFVHFEQPPVLLVKLARIMLSHGHRFLLGFAYRRHLDLLPWIITS